MITAAKARELALHSQASIDLFLENLSPVIEKRANEGHRNYAYYGSFHPDPTTSETVTLPAYHIFTTPEFWKRIIERLRASELGYYVEVCKDAPYVPLGLADDNGEGPQYVTHYLKITW